MGRSAPVSLFEADLLTENEVFSSPKVRLPVWIVSSASPDVDRSLVLGANFMGDKGGSCGSLSALVLSHNLYFFTEARVMSHPGWSGTKGFPGMGAV